MEQSAPLLPTLDRMFAAVQRVRDRLLRTVGALTDAGIPYAVAGGHAVGVWVATIDEGAVRNTPDVDVVVNRSDLDRIIQVMTATGFRYKVTDGTHHFLDGLEGRIGIGVRLLFAGERVRPDAVLPCPGLDESEVSKEYRVVSLEPLVRMKLTSFRMKDQMHLIDLAQQRLFDETWPDRFPPPLSDRLRDILADPDSRPPWGEPGKKP